MTNQAAQHLLLTLAQQSPDYAAQAAALAPCVGAPETLPEGFATDVVNLLRTDPDSAAAIDNAAADSVMTLAMPEWTEAAVVIATLVLLFQPVFKGEVKLDLKYLKAHFKLSTSPADLKTLKTVLTTLSTLLGQPIQGLNELDTPTKQA